VGGYVFAALQLLVYFLEKLHYWLPQSAQNSDAKKP
jgi:hypothetical protein